MGLTKRKAEKLELVFPEEMPFEVKGHRSSEIRS